MALAHVALPTQHNFAPDEGFLQEPVSSRSFGALIEGSAGSDAGEIVTEEKRREVLALGDVSLSLDLQLHPLRDGDGMRACSYRVFSQKTYQRRSRSTRCASFSTSTSCTLPPFIPSSTNARSLYGLVGSHHTFSLRSAALGVRTPRRRVAGKQRSGCPSG